MKGLLGSQILGANSRLTREKWNPPPPLFIGEGKGEYEPSHTISTVGSTQYQQPRSRELTPPDITSHPYASNKVTKIFHSASRTQTNHNVDYEEHTQN